ncbi:uncharacterized protein DS421_19g656860 [Arachis hypogaea]|uniref:Uncharacterized protein n=1 Tax=Arachis hypogaea TaxID=3818 RepID=A0A6B9V956_ARAHY|nr:uncharacterized protein DS421_19g656860 [Arachis hypogaea]
MQFETKKENTEGERDKQRQKRKNRVKGKREEGDPREGSAGGGGRTILADRRCRCVLLLAPPPPSRKLRFLLAVAVEIAKRDGSRVKGGRGLGAAAPSSPLFAFPVAVVQREASRGRCTSQPCLPPPCRRGGSRRVTERERERQGTGAEERKERPTPATAAYAARNPAAAAGVCITGKGFKLGFYSFGFREPLSSLHVYFSSPPPMLVVLNCCTVVVAVQVTGNMAVITGTTIGVTVISIQPIEFRVLIAEFYGCSIQHQGAVSSPELLLLHFLNYLIELRLCLEVVAAAGTVNIDVVTAAVTGVMIAAGARRSRCGFLPPPILDFNKGEFWSFHIAFKAAAAVVGAVRNCG